MGKETEKSKKKGSKEVQKSDGDTKRSRLKAVPVELLKHDPPS